MANGLSAMVNGLKVLDRYACLRGVLGGGKGPQCDVNGMVPSGTRHISACVMGDEFSQVVHKTNMPQAA